MFTKLTRKLGFTVGCLLATIIFLGICTVSWIATCGLVYLITLCFDWTFSWGIGTGVWLVIILLNGIFKKGNDK
jgi:hypothetical protein